MTPRMAFSSPELVEASVAACKALTAALPVVLTPPFDGTLAEANVSGTLLRIPGSGVAVGEAEESSELEDVLELEPELEAEVVDPCVDAVVLPDWDDAEVDPFVVLADEDLVVALGAAVPVALAKEQYVPLPT